jgi:hypothetical protein
MSILTKIARHNPADILLAGEALFLLTFFRACLALMPVHRIIRTIAHGRSLTPTPQAPPQEPARSVALRIRWAVESVTRNSPAAFVCFPQTLAGYTMLRLRRIPSTMVYGVARSPDSDAKLIAHTWLTLGDSIVLGGDGSDAFTPVDRWT